MTVRGVGSTAYPIFIEQLASSFGAREGQASHCLDLNDLLLWTHSACSMVQFLAIEHLKVTR